MQQPLQAMQQQQQMPPQPWGGPGGPGGYGGGPPQPGMGRGVQLPAWATQGGLAPAGAPGVPQQWPPGPAGMQQGWRPGPQQQWDGPPQQW